MWFARGLWALLFLSFQLTASNVNPCKIDAWLNVSQLWGSALNSSNSRLNEGDSIPLRYAVILPSGSSNTIFLKLDFTTGNGSPRFLDAFASSGLGDATVLLGYSGVSGGVDVAFPDDPQVPGDQSLGRLRIFNASVTGFGPYSVVNGVKVLPVQIQVAAGKVSKTVVLSYAGHLAQGTDWPGGQGAASYPGTSRKAFASVNADAMVSVSVESGLVKSSSVDLSVVQQVPASPVVVGATATFTITVKNLGPSAASAVTLENSLATGAVLETSQGTVNGSNVQIGSLGVGQSAVVTLRAPVGCDGLSNTATVSSPSPDPVSGNNQAVGAVAGVDSVPPQILGIPTVPTIAFAAPTACDALVTLPAVTAVDTCTQSPTLSATRGDGAALTAPFPLGVTRITYEAKDASGNRSEASLDVVVLPLNLAWPVATRLLLPEPDPNSGITSANIEECIALPSQSRWYKFHVQPGSKLLVTLENLAENYDLVLYKDIQQIYDELTQARTAGDLTQLNAEFAADAFAADAFASEAFAGAAFSGAAFSGAAWSGAAWSGAAFSGAAFSGAAWSPDVYAPDTFFGAAFSGAAFSGAAWSGAAWSPDAVAGAAFSGAAWSGAAWSGAAWSGAAWSGAAFSGAAFSTDAVSGAAWSGAAFSGAAFSDAQIRSIVGVSAFPGIGNEAILANTWDNAGDFYIRVRGRNGAFSPGNNFKLGVHMLTGACKDVVSLGQLPAPTLAVPQTGTIRSLIVADFQRLGQLSGTPAEASSLRTRLSQFAAKPEIAGEVVDVGLDARIAAANAQADANPACATAKNIVAEAIRELINRYRDAHPEIETVTLVGNDGVIPFFRQPDQGLLANENNYVPPVLSTSASEAALKLGYFLTQDYYGTQCELSLKVAALPIPDLGVGRLVETIDEITTVLNAYDATAAGVIPTPTSSLVTGYDFLADAADAIAGEFLAGTGVVADQLVQPVGESPDTGWNADQFRAKLLGSRHDLIFLGGHFSAGGALAADYKTRMAAEELAGSPVNLVNSVVFSAGCHSGYNLVNSDAVPEISPDPDWAQAFARKGAALIAGTGYQYGDTEILEYSERLYLNFAKELRYGTGPVALGKALARAKTLYLAETPVLRGLHEKALLQATLFGLPMLSVNLPSGRGTPLNPPSIVTSLTPAAQPGETFALKYADIGVQTTLTKHTRQLVDLDAGGNSTVTASYYSGENGVAGNPSEPLFPLEIRDVTVPGLVLRGVGFRTAVYDEEFNQLPFTSAPATELSGAHAPFLADALFPIRFWNVNYFDALCSAEGTASEATRLFLMPAQFVSKESGNPVGTFRKFSALGFRLFYNKNTTAYHVNDGALVGTISPALSAPPSILNVSDSVSTANPGNQSVRIQVRLVGNPFAGMQEVWVTYTGIRGTPGFYGQWQSLNLTQPDPEHDSSLWEGTLNTGTIAPGNLRYVVQAVNGVGLVALDTKLGSFYIPGGVSGTSSEASVLQLDPANPTSAAYSTRTTFRATLTSGGLPLAGHTVNFALGTQELRSVTDANGVATIAITVLGFPGQYDLRASFVGDDLYKPSQASAPFSIEKQTSQLNLSPTGTIYVQAGVSTPFVAQLTSAGSPLAERTVFFVFTPRPLNGAGGAPQAAGAATAYYFPVITDFAGRALLSTLPPNSVPDGTYNFAVYFGSGIPGQPINASDPRYAASTTAGLAQFETVTVVVNDPEIAVQLPSNVTVGTSLGGVGDCSALVELQATANAGIADQLTLLYSVGGSTITNPHAFPIGTTHVDAVAKIGDTVVKTGALDVTVIDDEPPVARVKTMALSLGAGQSTTVTALQLDAGSTDNCSLSLLEIGLGNLTVSSPGFGSSVTVGGGVSGDQIVTLRATDASGNRSVATGVVRVSRPPPLAVTVTPDPSRLTEPNHKLVPVILTINAVGLNPRQLSYRVVSVSSNEPLNGGGDGDRSPDWVFDSGPNSIFEQVTSPTYSITERVRLANYGWSSLGQNRIFIHLRAERRGNGSGRTYTIQVETRDAAGNLGTATCTVFVPKTSGSGERD